MVPPVVGDIDWTGRLKLQGRPLAVVRQSSSEIAVQVPWETSIGIATSEVDLPSDSPFIQRGQAFVFPQAAALWPTNPTIPGIMGGRLIKGDFSGPVTEIPRTGDIVHIFATGLGSVRGSMQTGQPAPLNELRPLTAPVRCRFLPYPSELENLFAGLAPGLIGIYQLTFRLGPDTPPSVSPSFLQCSIGSSGLSVSMAPLPSP